MRQPGETEHERKRNGGEGWTSGLQGIQKGDWDKAGAQKPCLKAEEACFV